MEIELYHTPHTRALRPRWFLEELEIPYTLRPVDLFAGEQNPEHPLGSVPAIRIDGQIMFESGAICHWLADRFPEKALAPALDDRLRLAYEQWMFFTPGTLEPPAFEILMHTKILPEKIRVPEIVTYAKKNYRRVLSVVASQLAHNDYILGNSFSCADIMVASTLNVLPEFLESHPKLQDYVERTFSRDACIRALQTDNSG